MICLIREGHNSENQLTQRDVLGFVKVQSEKYLTYS
jgi:hypothetical protein